MTTLCIESTQHGRLCESLPHMLRGIPLLCVFSLSQQPLFRLPHGRMLITPRKEGQVAEIFVLNRTVSQLQLVRLSTGFNNLTRFEVCRASASSSLSIHVE